MKKFIFKWQKDDYVGGDGVHSVESAMREFTEARDIDGSKIDDPDLDEADMQFAKENLEIIIKRWRKKR